LVGIRFALYFPTTISRVEFTKWSGAPSTAPRRFPWPPQLVRIGFRIPVRTRFEHQYFQTSIGQDIASHATPCARANHNGIVNDRGFFYLEISHNLFLTRELESGVRSQVP